MRVASLLLTIATGCAQWVEFPDVEGPGDIEGITPGRYSGEAELEVRAFMGPVLVRREVCTTPVVVDVDPTADALISGEIACVFEEIGEVDADVTGRDVGLPLVEGEVGARHLDATWDGWFIDEALFYGELVGESPYEGLELRYRGWMLADRFAPLSSATLGR